MSEQEMPEPTAADVRSAASDPENIAGGDDGGESEEEEEDTPMTIFGREPVAIVGIVTSVILAVVSALMGQGVISDALAGKVTDVVNAIAQLIVLALPAILNIIVARPRVTPTT